MVLGGFLQNVDSWKIKIKMTTVLHACLQNFKNLFNFD